MRSPARPRPRRACSTVTRSEVKPSTEVKPKWDEPAIRVLMMPRDTNAHGTIFGGVILSYIDQAGAIEARRQGLQFMVTVSMDKVSFHEPVFVGDLVSFWTETTRIGTTSITTKVVVEAIRAGDPSQRVTVTEAQVVYVNIGQDRRPAPIVRKTNAYEG
jgi:acyl-CoA thioesterase YciA